MKKFFFSVFLILLLAIVGILFALPYGLGYLAENQYTRLLEVVKPNDAQITLVSYHRGWFSSEAVVKIEVPATLSAEGEKAISVKQHIEHGPLFSFTDSKGQKQLTMGQALIKTHVNSALGDINGMTLITLAGAFVGTIDVPKLGYIDTENQNILAIQNISGTFKLSADMKHFVGQLHIPQLTFKTNKFAQQADGAVFSYDLTKSPSGLFLGKRHYTIDAIAVSPTLTPNKALKLQELQITGHDAEQDHKIKSDLNIELKYVTFNNASYGPQQLEITVNQLDVPTVLMFKKELQEFSRSEMTTEQKLQKYQQLSAELLSKGLEMQIKKLAIVTPWGAPSLVANFTVPAQPETTDMKKLVSVMSITADVNIPASFLVRVLESLHVMQQTIVAHASATTLTPSHANPTQMAQQQIAEWVNKKWLTPKDNGYHVIIVYQNGQATINSQPIHVPQPQPDTIRLEPTPAAPAMTIINDHSSLS